MAVTGGDREVLRAPATQPVVDTVTPSTPPAPTTPTTSRAHGAKPRTPVTTAPVTAAAPTLTTGAPVVTVPPAAPAVTPAATTTDAVAAPTTSTYTSIGGSITVRLADRRISLDGAPNATSGWSTRIDDDGPDRVRVRFELDDRRSEIRVDLEDGRLVQQIIES